MPRIAVITGASAGIGAATARALKSAGFDLVLGARREERLRQVAEPLGARWALLDVTDAASVARFAELAGPADVVVNNAGMGLGMDRVADAVDERWQAMYDTNVLGAMRVNRAFLPTLVARGGHLVVVGSTSGFEVYAGGAGYTASKHALRAMTKTLRLELLGTPVRVTEISPGLVETEFATVRHGGDASRAKAVYRGMTPLTAEDVAACVAFAVGLPPHVNVDEVVVRPVDQASSTAVHRRD
jgi:NADP-dependent 3-hydroxy acid dehydrogenase YdfG